MDRRRFLEGVLAGGAVLGLKKVQAGESGAAQASLLPLAQSADKAIGRFPWQAIILCQFADARLVYKVQVLSAQLGCILDHAEPGSWDILGIPAFIIILDRTTMSRDMWLEFVSVRKEVDDDTLCVLVDALGQGENWPIDEHMVILDPKSEVDIRAILGLVRREYDGAQAFRLEDVPSDSIATERDKAIKEEAKLFLSNNCMAARKVSRIGTGNSGREGR